MKTAKVVLDEFTKRVSQAFDYDFDGTSCFDDYDIPDGVPSEFQIGLIVGASGSGKSSLLSKFGDEENPEWDNEKAIVSNFSSVDEAIEKLTSVGLNSIPSWVRPYDVLSTGEKFRASLSRKLHSDSVIDEFTSTVDRNVAKSTSVSVSKYIRRNNLHNIIFATCHFDVIEWLEPDWVFNTDSGLLTVGRHLRRPKIEIKIFRTDYHIWRMFRNHHYLNSNLNKASRCFVGFWGEIPVAFTAAITYPSGTLKNAWREHRTVVLPDYQGMGIGTRFSDAIAKMFVDDGKRYFSRTAHIRMGEYRNKSSLWRPTSKNMVVRHDIIRPANGDFNNWYADQRVTYSHEYIGE